MAYNNLYAKSAMAVLLENKKLKSMLHDQQNIDKQDILVILMGILDQNLK